MKLKRIALIAEIVSGTAVVVTVILLILGIRENSDLTRLSIYTGHIDSINRLMETTIRDPELSEIWVSLINNEMEPPEAGVDRMRLNQFVQSLFRIYETAWLSKEYKVIGDTEWLRFEDRICNLFEDATSAELIFRPPLTDAFLEYMEATCSLGG